MNLKKSLHTIKNHLTQKEETLKALKKIYPHLADLSETQIVAYFEIGTLSELKRNMESIKISKQLRDDNQSVQNISICSCTDSKGQSKNIYASEESAQREAHILTAQKKLHLSVYLCPNQYGWHLTKG